MENNQAVTTPTPALTLDAPELSLADYRALREGRDVTARAVETPAETTPAADAAIADAETAVEGETENNSSEESKQEPAAKPAKKDGLQSRFSELTAENKRLKAQLAQQGATPAEPQKPAAAADTTQTPSNDPEPDASKFDSYVEWQKAWMRWDRRQDARAEAARTAETAKQTAAAARNESWNSRVTEAKAEFADFDSVAMNRDLPVTTVMATAIQESELGPQVLYHLGKHPAEAARIAKLTPASQVRELGKLEAKLEAETAAEPAEPQKKATPVSKAPAPIRPISGAAAASASAKAIESMSLSEYRALRESGKLR